LGTTFVRAKPCKNPADVVPVSMEHEEAASHDEHVDEREEEEEEEVREATASLKYATTLSQATKGMTTTTKREDETKVKRRS